MKLETPVIEFWPIVFSHYEVNIGENGSHDDQHQVTVSKPIIQQVSLLLAIVSLSTDYIPSPIQFKVHDHALAYEGYTLTLYVLPPSVAPTY